MKDFGITFLRWALGAIALYNAARLLGVMGGDGITDYTNRLVAANVPAAQAVAYVIVGLLVLSGLSLVLGFYTRQGAIALALVNVFHLLSGPTFDSMEGVDRATRVAMQLHALGFVGSISIALQGPGMLAMKA